MLSEADIRAGANEQSFDRGYTYFRNDDVLEMAQRGNSITASVAGSYYEPYKVQVVLDEQGIQSAVCDCPYDWGGYCKHIVAVLLTVIHDTDAIDVKPEMDSLLADLTEAQLRQLIITVSNEQLDFADAVEREIKWLQTAPTAVSQTPATIIKVDTNAIIRTIRKGFSDFEARFGGGYDSYDYYDVGFEADEILHPHFELVSQLLDAGDVDTAVSVATLMIEQWIDSLTHLSDWVYEYDPDAFDMAAAELGEILAEVLLSQNLDTAAQKEWLKRITYWEKALGNMGMAATAVRQNWGYPPLVAVLQGQINENGAWEGNSPYFADELARVRLRILQRQGRTQEYLYLAQAEGQLNLYVNMLARSGETETAVAAGRKFLNSPREILSLSQILVEQGEVAAALEIAKFGLTMEVQRGSSKLELAQWLQAQAEANDKPTLALTAAQVAFASNPTLRAYQAVQALAGDQWPDIQKSLLKELKSAWSVADKVDIYLHEGMLKQAMQAVNKDSYYDHDLHRVIDVTRADYPDWGIKKCKQKAEKIMDGGVSKNYDTAVSWLQLAHDIYQQHDRANEWQNYLNSLLDKHQRKYKLVPMLRRIT